MDHRDEALTTAFVRTTRATPWRLVQKVPLRFPTHHPQGLAVVGDTLILSTVEVLEAPARLSEPDLAHDRTAGRGIGHLLVLDRQARLLCDIVVGAGSVYHPGGVDVDGESAWVPVAEYRPHGRSTLVRLDLRSFEVEPVFDVDDHIGAVVRDRVTGNLHGASWGSRTMYAWTSDGTLLSKRPNVDHLIDYQDCAYV
ncbi:MAG TPA: DUF6454 family protein, partial [Actinopolymorphaceae bacterium]|nr:DUF6454 family protein [Actinopolymorphaceae bacterium]